MTSEETYRKLQADIRRELDENERDLRKAADRYDELIVERRKLWNGYYGIKAELDNIKGAD